MEFTKFSRGEVLHNVLQAGCRIGIRKGSAIRDKEFKLYVISATQNGLQDRMKDAFPGCSVVEWTPQERPLSRRQRELVDYVNANLGHEPASVLRYTVIGEALGISTRQLSALRNHPRVTEALGELGIESLYGGATGTRSTSYQRTKVRLAGTS